MARRKAVPTTGDWVRLMHRLLVFKPSEPIDEMLNIVERELRQRGKDPLTIRAESPFV